MVSQTNQDSHSCPESFSEWVQRCQFGLQDKVYEILLDVNEYKVVLWEFDTNNRESVWTYYDGNTCWNMTVRRFLDEILNLGNSQIMIDQDYAYELDYQLSQGFPLQFDVLA